MKYWLGFIVVKDSDCWHLLLFYYCTINHQNLAYFTVIFVFNYNYYALVHTSIIKDLLTVWANSAKARFLVAFLNCKSLKDRIIGSCSDTPKSKNSPPVWYGHLSSLFLWSGEILCSVGAEALLIRYTECIGIGMYI